jgi:hypothetical protein
MSLVFLELIAKLNQSDTNKCKPQTKNAPFSLPFNRLLTYKHIIEKQYNQTIDSDLYTLVSCISANETTLFCFYFQMGL